MLQFSTRKIKQKGASRRRVKYCGIVTEAEMLGVSREYLWAVLEGKWVGKRAQRLLRRHQELKRRAA